MTIPPLTEADLAAIEARLFRDYPDHERWREAFAQVKVDAEALLADNRRLRAALAFYANRWPNAANGDTARRALAGEG